MIVKNSSKNTPENDSYRRDRLNLFLLRWVLGSLVFIAFGLYSFFKDFKFTENPVDKCTTHFTTYNVVEEKIENRKYRLLVADSSAKHTYGLMNVKAKKDICGNDGMIFIFDQPGIQTFWNQGTLIDLKLYWMLGDRVLKSDDLVNITDNGMKIYSSILPVNRVVEIIK
ncbi:MAG: DUF192 domain-containing protein [Patescibacteria group bacterium]